MYSKQLQQLVCASALVLVSGLASAQGMGGGAAPAPMNFADIDTDNSGTITMEEMSAVNAQMAERMFPMVDADKDGNITQEEWDKRPQGGAAGGAAMGMG